MISLSGNEKLVGVERVVVEEGAESEPVDDRGDVNDTDAGEEPSNGGSEE